MATWGDGAPVRHHHDYAPLDHRHQQADIDGAPDPDYIVSDELEDRLRDFKEDLDREVDDNFAKTEHYHDAYVSGRELDDKLADIGADLGIDELVGRVNELRGYTAALRDRMREIERDRAAIIRRMRLLEDALSLTPPAETLTGDDAPPFAPARCGSCGRVAGAPSAPCPQCPGT